jgi:hypothetical protein
MQIDECSCPPGVTPLSLLAQEGRYKLLIETLWLPVAPFPPPERVDVDANLACEGRSGQPELFSEGNDLAYRESALAEPCPAPSGRHARQGNPRPVCGRDRPACLSPRYQHAMVDSSMPSS